MSDNSFDNSTETILKLARLSAGKAVLRVVGQGRFRATPQDFEDMRQEAAEEIFRAMPRALESARDPGQYLFAAGKNAAIDWWRSQVLGLKCHDDQGCLDVVFSLDDPLPDGDPHDDRTRIPELASWPFLQESNHPYHLTGDRARQVRQWIADLGPWKSEAKVDQAMHILEMALQDYTDEDIAKEVGLSPKTVDWQRRAVRRVFKQVGGWENYSAPVDKIPLRGG